ncbi:MAG: hypothetical protein AB1611_14550 [bacterium]
MNHKVFDQLCAEIQALAMPVGFSGRNAANEIVSDITPPSATWVWRSPFAIIALCPVEKSTPSMLLEAQKEGTAWLDQYLITEEKYGRLIDGYLLLALPATPDDELRRIARQVELDPHLCRKHVLWPSENGEWTDRLCRITTLGLPPSPEIVKLDTTALTLPAAAQEALALYADTNSIEKTVGTIEKLAETAEGEESDNVSR